MNLLKESWRVFKEHFAATVIAIASVVVALIPPGIMMWLFPPTLITVGLLFGWIVFAICALMCVQEAHDNLKKEERHTEPWQ